MEFSLYNSLTRSVDALQPQTPGHLKFYACGPTVYSYAHIGNFRSFLTADLIVRVAQALGWKTSYVCNITDVGHLSQDDYADSDGEDKMERALRSKEGEAFVNIWDLARYYTDALRSDWQTLNLQQPQVQPRATEHVAQQIAAIQRLIEAGAAYETPMGVYFHVPAYPNYGHLSGNVSNAELAGAREVVTDSDKRDPRDFALWKKDEKHLMRWFSPWGWGYPGWHIECSAMAIEYLGPSIDLHSGGMDNKFPHHECEIAQSECLTNQPYVKHWVHSGYLQVNGEKMSKSRGNFFTVRDLVYGGHAPGPYLLHPLALRYALTSGRYREPFNFTIEHAKACAKLIERIQHAYGLAKEACANAGATPADSNEPLTAKLATLYDKALQAMLGDLNTSVAYAQLLEGASLVSATKPLEAAAAVGARAWFEGMNALLGVIEHDAGQPAQSGPQTGSPGAQQSEADSFAAQVEALIEQRKQARKSKDFALADKVRDELQALGVEIRDSPEGTTWRRVLQGDG